MTPSNDRAILVVGHPGHELYLHGWIERARPRVFILTDGSGGAGAARINHSARCVAAAGGSQGSIFGQRSDRDWYAALLDRDASPFIEAAAAIVAAIQADDVRLVVSDARDGYNPMHDAAYDLAAIAVDAAREAGRTVDHAVVPAVGRAPDRPIQSLELDAAAVQRKVAAFEGYTPLQIEIAEVRAAPDFDVAREPMFAVYDGVPAGEAPSYETFGAQRVREGAYPRAVTHAGDYRAVIRATREALLG